MILKNGTRTGGREKMESEKGKIVGSARKETAEW